MRYIVTAIFSLFLFFAGFAQETKTVQADSLAKAQLPRDSLSGKVVVQDSIKKETRKERKERKKAEEEREKYYFNGIKKDSARLEIERLSHVAWRRSLMVPGWGQYTNKGLWWVKVPIIYGGFVGSYLVLDYWQWYYKKFLNELDYRIANNYEDRHDPDLINWEPSGLIAQKDYARRNRDLTILVTVGWWGLNVVEAYSDSILKNRWNIGRDMTMRLRPTFIPSLPAVGGGPLQAYGVVPGLKLTMNLN